MIRQQIVPKYTPLDNTLIIDGKYLAYRTKYSRGNNLSFKGINTGLFYGFFNTLKSVAKRFNPINTIIMWDSNSKNSIRKTQFEGYKQRKKNITPEELNEIIEFNKAYEELIEYCDTLGFASHILEGYEADDLIALWVNKFNNCTNVIITKDEDIYQCIKENTFIFDPDNKIKKDLKWFIKNYGIEPKNWKMVKGIGGCKSDTVPGVKNIGEKRAIEYILGKASDKIKEKIENHSEDILFYLSLVSLPHPTLYNYDLKFKTTKINMDKFFEFCQFFGLKKFIEEIYDFETYFS